MNRRPLLLFFSIFIIVLAMPLYAQNKGGSLTKGNELYRASEYEKAEMEYNKVLEQENGNYKAAYNKGNALFRQKKFKEAAEAYTVSAGNTNDKEEQFRSLHNKGTALARQDDLPGAIAALKQALKINPNDDDCRFNLAKAQAELKKQQQNNNNTRQQQQQQPQNQPPQRKSKLNNEQLKQVLLAIRKKEKEVQNRLKNNQSPGIVQPEKDW